MSAPPLVTLGVPVYNGARYLEAALDCLVAQDYERLEIVVSDNASTDETADIVASAAARDDRIRPVRQLRNRGGVWNVNHLLDQARGTLFKWAYYDDLCAPTFVSRCVAALEQAGPEAVLACSRTVTVGVDGERLEERDDAGLALDDALPHRRLHHLLEHLANQTEFGVMRTAAARRTRGVQPHIGSEMFFLSELLLQGPFVMVPEQLLGLRRHPDQYGRDRFSEVTWYVGSGQPPSLLPFAKMNALLYRAVLDADLPGGEKARCLRAVATGWTLPRWRNVAADVKNLPRTYRLCRELAQVSHNP